MSKSSEILNAVRQMQSFASDLQKHGTDLTDPDTISWMRKNPEFSKHADKLYVLMHGQQAPANPDWIEDAQMDVPTSRRWREEQQKQKKKR